MTTATTGTGTITLGAAVAGFLTFALAGVADAEIVAYGIRDGANSEVGVGTYTSAGTTLTRTVRKSTNSDSAISLSGTAQVYITALEESYRVITDTAAVARTDFPAGLSNFQVLGTTTAGSSPGFGRWSNDTGGVNVTFLKSRGGAVGTSVVVGTNDTIARLNFVIDGGSSTLLTGARIEAAADGGTMSTTSAPTKIIMSTVPDGSITITETLRLAGAGQVVIRNNTAVPAAGGTVATTAMALQFSSAANFGIFVGSGVPTVAAATGSLYLRTDGTSTTTRIYVRTDAATWANFTVSA